MLTEAQIEIVDESGVVEDRVRIVGNGEVALASGRSRLQLSSDEPADLDAVITLRDGVVTVEARKDQMLRVGDEALAVAQPRAVQQRLEALVAAVGLRRPLHLHVRTIVSPSESLMAKVGTVIRDEPSELESWLATSIIEGAAEVSEELARLRAEGAIDEEGNLLVPFPADMHSDSKTDV